MQQEIKITSDIYWIGGNDPVNTVFENHIPIPEGVSYNSYFIDDEKTAVVDTTDAVITELFLDKAERLLAGRALDYIIVNHMEPDHSASLLALAEKYPTAKICGSAAALRMAEQFFHVPLKERWVVTNERMRLPLGRHTLRFFAAPMVHWPEVTFTYDETDAVLFSADAFGTFGRLDVLFADETDYRSVYEDSARRYYTSIVSKHGPQVQAAMKKVSAVPVSILAPLHGPVFRTEEDISYVLGLVSKWAAWEPAVRGAAVCYASIYGHTEKAARLLGGALAGKGISVKYVDLCHTDVSYAMAAVMERSHLVLAAPTYNMELFPKMQNFLEDLSGHLVHDRAVAIIGNSTWAPNVAGKRMEELTADWKGLVRVGETVHVKSAVGPAEEAALSELAEAIAADISQK